MFIPAVRKVDGESFLYTAPIRTVSCQRGKRLEHNLESYRGGPARDYLLIFISFLVQTERWEQKKEKMIRKESNK